MLKAAESGVKSKCSRIRPAGRVWVRVSEYFDFLCVRVEGSDLEPGVLVLPLPSCVTQPGDSLSLCLSYPM